MSSGRGGEQGLPRRKGEELGGRSKLPASTEGNVLAPGRISCLLLAHLCDREQKPLPQKENEMGEGRDIIPP